MEHQDANVMAAEKFVWIEADLVLVGDPSESFFPNLEHAIKQFGMLRLMIVKAEVEIFKSVHELSLD
ncbi:hypothetical protein D3C86_2096340 [compost metagenome]